MTKKPSESFREYAQMWCQTASQVQPALTEKDKMTIYMSTLSTTYHNKLIGHTGASFGNLVQTAERIEEWKNQGLPKALQINIKPYGRTNQEGISPIRGMKKAKKKFIQFQVYPLDASNPMFIQFLYFHLSPII